MRTLGRRGETEAPLSQKSKIFASSPKGRAKAAFGGSLPDKLQFDHRKWREIPAIFHIFQARYRALQASMVS